MTQSGRSEYGAIDVLHQAQVAKFIACVGLILALNLSADDNVDEATFDLLTEAEEHSIEPTLHETHFNDGYPRLYRRHRLVRIDTEALRSQLHNNWMARQGGADANGVAH